MWPGKARSSYKHRHPDRGKLHKAECAVVFFFEVELTKLWMIHLQQETG